MGEIPTIPFAEILTGRLGMSNCIKPSRSDEIVLTPEGVDYSKLREVQDEDGNALFCDNGTWILRMGFTTIREWRHFLWNHVQPFVKVENLGSDFYVFEESDGMANEVKWPIRFLPPGTVKTAENFKVIF